MVHYRLRASPTSSPTSYGRRVISSLLNLTRAMWQSDFFFYLIVILVIILAVGLIVLIHAGFFYTLRLRIITPPVLPHHVAYTLRTGAYKNVGSAFQSLCKLIPPSTRTFGIYYDDDEKQVPQEQLRYVVGCCLPDPLERTGSSRSLEEKLQKHGYQLHTFPFCDKAIVTEYPWRNYLSILLAIYIVYPAIQKYIKDQNVKPGPCIEYYEKDFIRYIVPLDHHEGFYVPGVEPIRQ